MARTAPPPPTHPPAPPHAVVVGAGLDGLAATTALGRHVERVTLIAREDLPGPAVGRHGGARNRHRRLLRCVLDSPRVVVRPGLEAVGLVVAAGRVEGLVVRTRRVAGPRPTLTIHADLVVDARDGHRQIALAPAADGLVVLGPFPPGRAGDDGAARAATTAAALDRCLAEHLRRCATLSGFSLAAQRAVAQADPGGPGC
ncbi:MAG TPA: hypothetical protein VFZ79_01180 [Acidimicrobiales bacterium]